MKSACDFREFFIDRHEPGVRRRTGRRQQGNEGHGVFEVCLRFSGSRGGRAWSGREKVGGAAEGEAGRGDEEIDDKGIEEKP